MMKKVQNDYHEETPLETKTNTSRDNVEEGREDYTSDGYSGKKD